MLRTTVLCAAFVAFSAPALAQSQETPVQPLAVQPQTAAPGATATIPNEVQGTKIKTSSGYQGCGWSSAAAPVS
ncbi:MAG: hypothetical protein AAGB11_08695 [Pseudomonadota bacterium]